VWCGKGTGCSRLSVPCEWRVAGERGLVGTFEKLEKRWSGGGVFKNEKYLRRLLCENCGKWLGLHALVRGSTLDDANFIFQLKKKI